MVNFCWEAQIRVGTSDSCNIEKVRKKFIMKNFSNRLFLAGFELPSQKSQYKGPIRILLAALLAAEIDFLRDSQRRSIQPYSYLLNTSGGGPHGLPHTN